MTIERITLLCNCGGVIIGIFGLLLSLLGKEKQKNSIVTFLLVAMMIIFVCSSVFVLKYDFEEEESFMSEEEMLAKAEEYFAIKDYFKTVEIYNNSKLDTNPIALNNLGYMYENGIFFEKDISVACEFYKKAADLGNAEAYENYIIIRLKNPLNYYEIISLIREGLKINSGAVNKIVGYCIEDINEETIEKFAALSDEEMISVISNNMTERVVDEREIREIENNDFYSIKYVTEPKKVQSSTYEYWVKEGDFVSKRSIPIFIEIKETKEIYSSKVFALYNELETTFIKISDLDK